MATYSVRGYSATGFNPVNIPSSPSVLEKLTYEEFPALEVLQDLDLGTLRIKATYAKAKDLDYIELINSTNTRWTFYIVTNVRMVATDVAELTVVCDYWNTLGGIGHLKPLDGITSRVHVVDDIYGKYTEEDVLTAPTDHLNISVEWLPVWGGPDEVSTYIESSIDLVETAASRSSTTYVGGYEDVTQAAVVAKIYPVGYNTQHLEVTKKLQTSTEFVGSTGVKTYPQTRVYKLNDSYKVEWDTADTAAASIVAGISAARALGVENAITKQVQIPDKCIDTLISYRVVNYQNSDKSIGYYTDQEVSTIKPKLNFGSGWSSEVKPIYAQPKNTRVMYGGYTPVGIITNAGNKIEINAEDCQINFNIDGQSRTTFGVQSIVDPHLDGKCYYSLWRNYSSYSSSPVLGTLAYGVAGLPWKQIPLVYSQSSGNLLNQYNLQNKRLLADTEASNYGASYDLSKLQNKLNILTGSYTNMSSPLGLAGGTIQGYAQNVALDVGFQNANDTYQAAKAAEMSQYAISNNVYVPTINFPYNSEIVRDNYGEGVIIYRYEYTDADVKRIDKLLTMYGYKFTHPLVASDFSNRKYFNYVECSNVTLKSDSANSSMRLLDGAASQLRVGVRLWHVKPSVTYYNDNPVV